MQPAVTRASYVPDDSPFDSGRLQQKAVQGRIGRGLGGVAILVGRQTGIWEFESGGQQITTKIRTVKPRGFRSKPSGL